MARKCKAIYFMEQNWVLKSCFFHLQVRTIDAEDIRREKGTFTREKNLLFLKNLLEFLEDSGNLGLVESVREKSKLNST